MTEVVHSVMPRDEAELRSAIEQTPAETPLVELRADAFRDGPDALEGALARWREAGVETLATVRSRTQGGEFAGDEDERAALTRRLARTADRIDVEWTSATCRESFGRCRKVVSHHDFEETPANLAALARDVVAAVPDLAMVKIAATPRSHDDLLRLLALPGEVPEVAVAAIGMGERGLPTRVLAARTGCALSFGRPADQPATGPGQPTTAELLEDYRLSDWTDGTALSLVVGKPIGHSLSPLLHNRAYHALGLDRRLVPLLVDDFAEALDFAGRFGADAIAITMPFKQDARDAAAAYRDEAGEAERAGAANCLRRTGQEWTCANTDGLGVVDALREAAPSMSFDGTRTLLLGAGGAAKAAAHALSAEGGHVIVCARRSEEAEALAAAVGGEALPWSERGRCESEVVLNATPLGMTEDRERSVMPPESLRPGQLVMEMIYRPRWTPLLRAAERAGAQPVPGAAMFLHQARHQIAWFTRQPVPLDLLRPHLDEALEQEDPPR